MGYKVLVASRSYSKYSEKTKKYLQDNNCQLVYNEIDRPYKEEDLLKVIEDYDAIVVGVDEVTEKVITKGNKLKVIAKNGVGVDNIDLQAASEKGIYVFNAPGTNSPSVADLAVALMLSLGRKIPLVNNMTKAGAWKRKIGFELWEKTVGIIGTGDIGQGVAKRLTGFNCELLAYDLDEDESFASKYGVSYQELDEVLAKSDYLSLHLPLNDRTEGLIDSDKLKLIPETSYLINTARGGIVDEEDLYQALKDNEIAGAACDVFAEEPPGENKLFKLDNFIATSHIGAFTYGTNERTGMMVAKNMIKALQGKRPDNLVNDI